MSAMASCLQYLQGAVAQMLMQVISYSQGGKAILAVLQY